MFTEKNINNYTISDTLIGNDFLFFLIFDFSNPQLNLKLVFMFFLSICCGLVFAYLADKIVTYFTKRSINKKSKAATFDS